MRTMRTAGIFSTMVFLMVLAGCATQPATVQSGPDAETIDGKLYKVDHSSLDESYIDPTVDFSRFNKIFIAQLDVSDVEVKAQRHTTGPRVKWKYTDEDYAFIQNLYGISMTEHIFELGGYEQATETGENVSMIRIMLKQIAPTAPPDNALNRRADRATYVTEGSGTISIKGILQDGGSGEILSVFADEGESNKFWGRNDRFHNKQNVKLIFDRWAKLFRAKLDKAHGKSQG